METTYDPGRFVEWLASTRFVQQYAAPPRGRGDALDLDMERYSGEIG